MMDWTDRQDRYFLRLISRHVLLYTEMVTTGAVIHGDREHLLSYHEEEHPVALQLGGSDPEDMAESAKIGADFGYDEINMNVGCPSDRVQSGRFGACLMAEPDLIARCVEAMRESVDIPVTVKSRIGIDEQEPREVLPETIRKVRDAGCETFIIHARKAWLQGLSPKENREIPPLDYQIVYDMKQEWPDLEIIINGGIETLDQGEAHLKHVDGVMYGRTAYHNPYVLSEVDQRFYGSEEEPQAREKIIAQLLPHIDHHLAKGGKLHQITRHIHGLFQGERGARIWKRYLSENAFKEGSGSEVVQEALDKVLEVQSRVLA